MSLLYIACSITLWILPSNVLFEYFYVILSTRLTDPNLVHIMAIATVFELLANILSAIALGGIKYTHPKMVLALVIYLPFYIVYQLVVFFLMVIYLNNGSTRSFDVLSTRTNPDMTKTFEVVGVVLPIIPVLVFWILQITFNIIGMVWQVNVYFQTRNVASLTIIGNPTGYSQQKSNFFDQSNNRKTVVFADNSATTVQSRYPGYFRR